MKEERWETNKDNTNANYETTEAQTKKTWHKRTALER